MKCYKCGALTNGRHKVTFTDGDYFACCTHFNALMGKLLDLMVEMKKAL